MTAPCPIKQGVAEAILREVWNLQGCPTLVFGNLPPGISRKHMEPSYPAALKIAEQAIDACHAEEMQAALQLLLAAIGRLPVRIITGELTDSVLAADAVLKAVEQQL